MQINRVSSSSRRLNRMTCNSVAESAYEPICDSTLAGRCPSGPQVAGARLASKLEGSPGPLRWLIDEGAARRHPLPRKLPRDPLRPRRAICGARRRANRLAVCASRPSALALFAAEVYRCGLIARKSTDSRHER